MENLLESEENLKNCNELINTKRKYNEFEIIMSIYKKALEETIEKLTNLKQQLNKYYNYEIITDVTGRLKSPQSIVGKMQKKKICISYENMIEKINDIAGVRIVCNYKNDIYKIKNMIKKQKDIRIIKEKDYIKKAKKSGYSAYHIIIETPIKIKKEIIPIKVEIQIRTILMNFWANTEHNIRYKTNNKISEIDSIRLSFYAKIINVINDKIMKIHRKQTKSALQKSKILL